MWKEIEKSISLINNVFKKLVSNIYKKNKKTIDLSGIYKNES